MDMHVWVASHRERINKFHGFDKNMGSNRRDREVKIITPGKKCINFFHRLRTVGRCSYQWFRCAYIWYSVFEARMIRIRISMGDGAAKLTRIKIEINELRINE